MLEKLWNDPVWSKVIAGIILAFGAVVLTYFMNWWPAIGRFSKLHEDKTLSQKTVEPPTSVSPAQSQAIPPVMPLPQADMKQPVAGEPCKQPIVGLKRRPEVFVPYWRSVLNRLHKERYTYDIQQLFEVRGRIPVAEGQLSGKDVLREVTYTLNCMEDAGELRLEKLGTTSTYGGEHYENQSIVFRNP